MIRGFLSLTFVVVVLAGCVAPMQSRPAVTLQSCGTPDTCMYFQLDREFQDASRAMTGTMGLLRVIIATGILDNDPDTLRAIGQGAQVATDLMGSVNDMLDDYRDALIEGDAVALSQARGQIDTGIDQVSDLQRSLSEGLANVGS